LGKEEINNKITKTHVKRSGERNLREAAEEAARKSVFGRKCKSGNNSVIQYPGDPKCSMPSNPVTGIIRENERMYSHCFYKF
jgi:hypothetical protein